MDTQLRDWQRRLCLHFTDLRDRRRGGGSDRPVFGLEHGLSPQEVQELAKALQMQVKVHLPAKEHWLAWVVYSAELGYLYSGDEYWQTFETEDSRVDSEWRPPLDPCMLPPISPGVRRSSSFGSVGRQFQHYLLANHSRDSTQRLATTVCSDSLRVKALLFRGGSRVSRKAG